MILDEAQNIKNFKSQRWQTLLTFNSQRRLLITGTPLQNNLMELWSLLYFLMPSGPTMTEFQEWFASSVNTAVDLGLNDKKSYMTIQRLHTVLRPYLLRRTKAEVEKQMPKKIEHVVYCRLSNRQRLLYDDFMSRGKTKDAFSSGSYFSILNCVMQLRKVCNHPDLFESRPITTSFVMNRMFNENKMGVYERLLVEEISDRSSRLYSRLIVDAPSYYNTFNYNVSKQILKEIHSFEDTPKELSLFDCLAVLNAKSSLINQELETQNSRYSYLFNIHKKNSTSSTPSLNLDTVRICRFMLSLKLRIQNSITLALNEYLQESIENYTFLTPSIIVEPLSIPPKNALSTLKTTSMYNSVAKKQEIFFPDKSLLQYDCGKLQTLHDLLKTLYDGSHRVLLFTQMSKMLGVFHENNN